MSTAQLMGTVTTDYRAISTQRLLPEKAVFTELWSAFSAGKTEATRKGQCISVSCVVFFFVRIYRVYGSTFCSPARAAKASEVSTREAERHSSKGVGLSTMNAITYTE